VRLPGSLNFVQSFEREALKERRVGKISDLQPISYNTISHRGNLPGLLLDNVSCSWVRSRVSFFLCRTLSWLWLWRWLCVYVLIADPRVALTLLSQSSAAGPPSVTPKHLAEPSRAASWTHTGPIIGNPVLDREKISAPQAVDVRISYLCSLWATGWRRSVADWGGDMSAGCTAGPIVCSHGNGW